jgi:hypothetical protein
MIMLFVWFGLAYYFLILTVGCYANMQLIVFLLSFVAPSLSLIKFVIKQYDKQSELVKSCEVQLEKASNLLNTYIHNGIEPREEELIDIQNEIYINRQKPEVLPYWLYKKTKKIFQELTDSAAKEYIKKIIATQNKTK